MRIATWNVNSVKARKERLLAWLERTQPQVACLQELKVTEENFPFEDIEEAGYHALVLGQKTYNGVAILSREPAEHPVRGLDDGVEDSQARLLAATVSGVHVISAYFPNGERPGSEKYVYKLEWMKRLRAWLDRHFDASAPLALCGDFNVAPTGGDVAKPEQWSDTVLCRDEVRRALTEIQDFGLTDVFRKHHPDGGIYSWWDYQMLAFPKNNGLRIDHIYATEALAETSQEAWVDREERKGKKPSDHAPVLVDFNH
jgi:exodeoxyribonuclease-3